MASVSVRELRNHGGEVLDRVARGESLIVTRDGAEVAELVPRRRASRTNAELVAARRALPRMNVARLRADIDRVLDPHL